MAYKVIPNEALEIQTGLFLHIYDKIISGKTYVFRHLYSSSGYCFYDNTDEVYRDIDNGEAIRVSPEEIKPEERTYYTYMSLALDKNINDFVSVVSQNNFEIV